MTGEPVVAAAFIDRLVAAGCVAAEEEADELVAAAPDDDTLESWIQRRERGEPLAWIIGTTQFCGHEVRIDAGVYVPRRQSEELARRAAAWLFQGGSRARRAADLCTGAGAVALHLMAEAPSATVIGVDIDRQAVHCAHRNGVPAVLGDLAQPLQAHAFDVVTAVAPYVPTRALEFLPADVRSYEPRRALDGGHDGLAVVRRVVRAASGLLRADGWLLLELGGEQDRLLAPTLAAFGFGPPRTWCDEDGDLRGLEVQAIE